jgi:hypothetical protein
MHFQTFPEMGNFYDELYKEGFGFFREKNLKRKTSDKYMIFDAASIRNAKEFYESQSGS